MASIRVYSFKKVEAVLDVLASDHELRAATQQDASSLRSAGYDLSESELMVLDDIVTGARNSPLNDVPPVRRPEAPIEASVDFMAQLRAKWERLSQPRDEAVSS